MGMGIGFGALSLGILLGVHPLTWPYFAIGTATAAMYFVAMGIAPVFPGAGWTDPEFVAETPRPLGLDPQQLITYVMIALTAAAVGVAILK